MQQTALIQSKNDDNFTKKEKEKIKEKVLIESIFDEND